METKKRMPAVEFLKVYVTGVKAGKSNKEIASELGMKPEKCSLRASQLRKEYKGKVEVPYPTERAPRSSNKDAVAAEINALLAQFSE
jgi:hypothetical protein